MPTFTIDNIPYSYTLSGKGPLVILIHALMADSRMWSSTVSALHSAGYSTLTYDHPGHGSTTFPSPFAVPALHPPYPFDMLTRHAYTLAAHAIDDPKPSVHAVIGCSMGGVLALRFALLYPGVASHIIACDMPGMTSLAANKPKWIARIAQFRSEGVDGLARATVERWFPDPCAEVIKDAALEQTMTCTLDGYTAIAEGIMNYDYTAELGRIDGEKVMVLRGELDQAIGPPEVLEGVKERVKGAVFVEIKECGHIPPMQCKEEFEKVVVNFLAE